MAKVLEVIIFPHETLRKKANVVTTFDKSLSDLASNMIETMYSYRGIGLAATQVNDLRRLFVLDVTWREPSEEENKVEKNPEVFVNPELVDESGEIEYEEGCLSIPKVYGMVERSESIVVRYQDLKGNKHEAAFSGLKAICFQHELDHLNGVLFFDHLSTFKRRILLEKFQKLQLELKKEEE